MLPFTFFGGGIGLHKFYLRKPIQGILYLLFFWTWIPGLIAFVEFIIYACTSEERLNEKYEAASAGSTVIVAIAGVVGLVFVIGILAAIAVPAYQDYTMRALASGAFQQVEPLRRQVEQHIVRTGTIPATASEVPGINPVNVKDLRNGSPLAIAELADNGVIVMRFEPRPSPVGGKTVEWVPYVQNDRLLWRCSGGTLPAKYRPLACRT